MAKALVVESLLRNYGRFVWGCDLVYGQDKTGWFKEKQLREKLLRGSSGGLNFGGSWARGERFKGDLFV